MYSCIDPGLIIFTKCENNSRHQTAPDVQQGGEAGAPHHNTRSNQMRLSTTQRAALDALRAKKAAGLAAMPAAERSSYRGMGLTKTERAEMIGALVCSGSFIAGQHIPGASYRTLLALVARGVAKCHRASDGRIIVYAA
jgi:hypothetical protein